MIRRIQLLCSTWVKSKGATLPGNLRSGDMRPGKIQLVTQVIQKESGAPG